MLFKQHIQQSLGDLHIKMYTMCCDFSVRCMCGCGCAPRAVCHPHGESHFSTFKLLVIVINDCVVVMSTSEQSLARSCRDIQRTAFSTTLLPFTVLPMWLKETVKYDLCPTFVLFWKLWLWSWTLAVTLNLQIFALPALTRTAWQMNGKTTPQCSPRS